MPMMYFQLAQIVNYSKFISLFAIILQSNHFSITWQMSELHLQTVTPH